MYCCILPESCGWRSNVTDLSAEQSTMEQKIHNLGIRLADSVVWASPFAIYYCFIRAVLGFRLVMLWKDKRARWLVTAFCALRWLYFSSMFHTPHPTQSFGDLPSNIHEKSSLHLWFADAIVVCWWCRVQGLRCVENEMYDIRYTMYDIRCTIYDVLSNNLYECTRT